MNEEQAKQIVADLSKAFKVRRPKLTWHPNRDVGVYFNRENRIAVGGKSHFGAEPTVLHEFAHHLEYSRNGGRLAEKGRAHGPAFIRALYDVALEYYGDVTLYPWATEYKSIAKVALKRGYCVKQKAA